MLSERLQPGFSLVELMVGLAVFALLVLAAMPSFSTWIGNTRVRTAAEALNNGMQLARSEAIRSGDRVEFAITGGSTWLVTNANSGAVLQKREAEEGSSGIVVSIAPPGATKLTFHPLGVLVDNTDASPRISAIKVDSSVLSAADSRELCVTVASAGVVRMCDPQVALTAPPDPRTCLPAVPTVCQ